MSSVFIATVLLGFGSPSSAVTEDFYPAKDSRIRSNTLDECANAVATGDLSVGVTCIKPPCVTSRSAIHFDISSIPSGAAITSATLKLYVQSVQDGGGDHVIHAMRSLQPLWEENGLIWESYQCDNDATPRIRDWCNLGGDFDAVSSVAAFSPPSSGSYVVSGAEVLNLIDDAVQRRGGQLHLILKQAQESLSSWRMIGIGSRENSNVGRRPLLTVSWTAPSQLLPPSPWMVFKDETSERLTSDSQTTPEGVSCPSDWLDCDGEEKDIATGDFDDDGDDDIIVVRKRRFSLAGPRVDVLLVNRDGVLTDSPSFFPSVVSDARDVLAEDLDGDGRSDLVIATTCMDEPKFYRNDGERCGDWRGFVDAMGIADPALDWRPDAYPTLGLRYCAVAGGDLDGDGDVDLYFSNYQKENIPLNCGVPSSAPSNRDALLINEIQSPEARFIDETDSRLTDGANDLAAVAFGTAVEIVDLDVGDVDPTVDIIKTSTQYGVPPWSDFGVFILRNTGAGHFSWTPPTDILSNAEPYSFTATRLNGDQWLDFYVVTDFDDVVYRATNPTSYDLAPVYAPRTVFPGGNVKAADVDGDGDNDVGVSGVDVDLSTCGDDLFNVALLENDGQGNMSDPWPVSSDQNFHLNAMDMAFVDIDRDGCLDLFMGLCDGYRVFMNRTPPNCQEAEDEEP